MMFNVFTKPFADDHIWIIIIIIILPFSFSDEIALSSSTLLSFALSFRDTACSSAFTYSTKENLNLDVFESMLRQSGSISG